MIIILILFLSINTYSQKKIEKIVIIRQEIFDTQKEEESGFLYEAANFLHILTKESYIKNELGFKEGDNCEPLLFEEAERKLRKTGLLNPVSVEYEENEESCVVYVKTRDTWTTKPGASFATYGGKTTYSIELQEDNFLGYGKNFLLSYKKKADEKIYLITYKDPQFLNTKLDGLFSIWNTDEGGGYYFNISDPFDYINVKKGFIIEKLKERREFTLYWEGKKAYKYISRFDYSNLIFGKRIYFREDEAIRLQFFYEKSKRNFIEGKPLLFEIPYKNDKNYNFSYFGISFEKIKAKYKKTKGMAGFTSDEDFLLGPSFKIGFGFSSPIWNGEEGQILILNYEDGKVINNFFWQRKFDLKFKIWEQKIFNSYFSFFSNLHFIPDYKNSLTFSFNFDGFLSPNLEGVLNLGNMEGQRGYGYNIDSGSKRFRFSITGKKLFFENVLSIANIGLAIFADTGRIWGFGKKFKDSIFYTDIGFGVRLEVLRSKIAKISRLDFAYGFKEKGGFRISISSGEWFF